MTAIYTLQEVVQRYAGRTVLSVPALEIQQGEILVLVGPSGAGKSTLLRLLALLERPTGGKVQLHLGEKIVTYENASLEKKRRITMVFQRPVMLSRSVRSNVAYGLKLRGEKSPQERVNTILQRLQIDHLSEAQPATLSGGELQRVSIARAMVLQPQILLLDEPTAHLDPYNIQLIENFLLSEQQREGTTVIVVTHNIFQARRLAHRIGLLYDGSLVEVADTAKFFDNPHDPRTAAFISGKLIY